ncbi:MAG: HAMP domain-containing histidine kinase [Spirochaetales bacterium]|nr:HAMP domain-containing histidine kinase [Spirochaetales bacterium]
MNLKKRFHMIFALIILIPFASMLSTIIFVWMGWNSRTLTTGDLEAPRYLHSVLSQILSENYDEKAVAERGIVILLNNKGDVIYAHPELIKIYPKILDNKWEDSGKELYELFMNEMPQIPLSFAVFRYKGDAGLAIFAQALVSAHSTTINLMIKLIWIFYLGFILLPALAMSYFIRPMAKSILNLEMAAGEIGRGNWDVTLPPPVKGKKHPFAHLTRAFDQMRLELKENHDRQQRIMMAISHDLKTPLTSIKGYVEALQDGMARNPEELALYTSIIMEKTNLLEERITDLIHFSRLQTTEWQSRFSEFPLYELLNEAGGIFRNDALIRKRSLDLDLALPETLQIRGDRRMLFQVLENLFDNACRYTDAMDTIRFSAKTENGKVLITMEDSGSGIDEAHVPHIFDTFYRADSGRNTRGIGVGLASAKTIVMSHGGNIRYARTDLGGACFLIELPLSL